MRRYLLGWMSEAEEARIERAYLGSDESLEELRAHEDELIEDYLRGALEPGERAAFERLFLASPVRLERLVLLKALLDHAGTVGGASRPARSRPAIPSWSLAAAGLGVVAVAAGIFAGRAPGPSPAERPRHLAAREPGEGRLGRSVPGTASAPAPVPPPETVSEAAPGTAPKLAPAPETPWDAPPVSLRLHLPAVRGDGDVPVLDPGAAGQVALETPLDPRDGFVAHRGRLSAPDGRDAFVSDWQPNRGETTLRVLVPAAALGDGRHVLVVEGRDRKGEHPLEGYAFRVRRR